MPDPLRVRVGPIDTQQLGPALVMVMTFTLFKTNQLFVCLLATRLATMPSTFIMLLTFNSSACIYIYVIKEPQRRSNQGTKHRVLQSFYSILEIYQIYTRNVL